MMLYEVKRAASRVADVLRAEEQAAAVPSQPTEPVLQVVPTAAATPSLPPETPWSAYAPNASVLPGEPPAWS